MHHSMVLFADTKKKKLTSCLCESMLDYHFKIQLRAIMIQPESFFLSFFWVVLKGKHWLMPIKAVRKKRLINMFGCVKHLCVEFVTQ